MNPSPNILLITTDQQRYDSIAALGAGWMRTPNLDHLAEQGVLFERAYCTSPVCTPSRASLFTGQMPSRHGAWNIGCNVPESAPFISHTLAQNGYRTHSIGKTHWQAYTAPANQSFESLFENPRFPEWSGPYYGFQTVEFALGHPGYNLRAGHHAAWVRTQFESDEAMAKANTMTVLSNNRFGGEASDWDLPLRLHASVWTADRALEFLKTRDAAQPFFLHLGFQDPHHPHTLPRDFVNRVKAEEVPPPRYEDGELADKPPHFMAARRGQLEQLPTRGEHPMAGQGKGANYAGVSADEAANARAYYYSMVQLIDEQVGRVLQALDSHRLAENTIVVFTSDHGELLGDHGLWLKGAFHYEEVLRVPLLARWPANWRPGQKVQNVASLADIVPTLLSAAGIVPTSAVDGISWDAELRRASRQITRGHVVCEFVDDPRGLRLRTIITIDRKLTWYAGSSEGEFYDLSADPRERINLWREPARASEKAELLARLLDETERLERREARLAYS